MNTIQLSSSGDFCMLIPVPRGSSVSCVVPNPLVPNVPVFQNNFIVQANYIKTPTFAQVTGQINPAAQGISPNDPGWFFDDSVAVSQNSRSTCLGYNHFVEIIEPSNNLFCIRCCLNPMDCRTSAANHDCLRDVPGNYPAPNPMIAASTINPNPLITSQWNPATNSWTLTGGNGVQAVVPQIVPQVGTQVGTSVIPQSIFSPSNQVVQQVPVVAQSVPVVQQVPVVAQSIPPAPAAPAPAPAAPAPAAAAAAAPAPATPSPAAPLVRTSDSTSSYEADSVLFTFLPILFSIL